TTTTAPSTTAPPSSTTTTTTRPPTSTTVPPPTTTAPPTGPTSPSAPRNLAAYKFGSGVLLVWTAPTTGPVTGYNVYRKTATTALAKLADLGTGTTYTDASAAVGVTYTYAVSAENGTAEGPQSNQVTVTR